MDITTIILIIVLLIGIFIAYRIGHKAGAFQKHKEWQEALPDYRKDAIMKSRAVLGGQFSENLAPYLPDFPYLPTECRFLGKPTDFIVFKGMDEKEINEIVFVEVKSGNAKLSSQEKNLKDTIENKRIRFEEYRIPQGLTKKDGVEFDDDGMINGSTKKEGLFCESCGRPIKHKGKCMACNIKAKKEREGK
jgi:predicted Holliday junction resolvase-like endonuclease